MTITLTGQEFSRDAAGARKAAEAGAVFITEGGRPTHVLLAIADYQRLVGNGSIVDLLAMPDDADFPFEAPRLDGPLARPVDLS